MKRMQVSARLLTVWLAVTLALAGCGITSEAVKGKKIPMPTSVGTVVVDRTDRSSAEKHTLELDDPSTGKKIRDLGAGPYAGQIDNLSTDGKFVYFDFITESAVFRSPLSGGPAEMVQDKSREGSVSPDGRFLVYQPLLKGDFTILDMQSGARRQLTNGFADLAEPSGIQPHWTGPPSWSSDQKSIVVSADCMDDACTPAEGERGSGPTRTYVFDVDTTTSAAIAHFIQPHSTDKKTRWYYPSLLSNGDLLVLESVGNHPSNGIQSNSLVALDKDGKEIRRFASWKGLAVDQSTICPDSQAYVFSTGYGAGYAVNSEGIAKIGNGISEVLCIGHRIS